MGNLFRFKLQQNSQKRIPEGKRQYIPDVILTSGVQEQIYQIASLWSELEKRKIILNNKLKKS